MELLAVLGFLATGFAAGVLSGMFGVGGAVVSTPAIRALGASPIEAVGSTIPAILPAAISGAHRYAKAGLVDWRIAWTCGVAGTLLATVGAKVSDVVDARWLMVATAGLLMWSGVSSIRKGLEGSPAPAPPPGAPAPLPPPARGLAPRPTFSDRWRRSPARSVHERGAATISDQPRRSPASLVREQGEEAGAEAGGPSAAAVERDRPGTVALVAVGALAGFTAGLLGIGGGVIMVPLFTNVLRLPVKTAVASSLVAVAIFSVPAMISHALLGHIDWVVAILLTAGTVPGARLGSRIAIGTAERRMRLLLGAFFCIVAVVYGGRELIGIL
jgi:uncharacterized membrane protein YfcA